MKLYSTNNKQVRISIKEAVLQGLAPDNGLYMPVSINSLPNDFFDRLHLLSNQEIASVISAHLIGDEVPPHEINRIIDETISFDVPLIQIEPNVWSLELFHGPTLAFKDFGARFMASLLGYFVQQEADDITILVATSGDTGSAVAHGFHNVPGIKVIVLYPSNKVSELQEKQFTTLGDNITAIEVQGTFDDCQRLVKSAFQDKFLRDKLNLTSANSINIARLIPQSFYYFFSYALMAKEIPVVYSVPSGNFGNLTGGVFAMKMGLPIRHFVAVTNINDVVPRYLKNGKFLPRPSVQTISNAMDVGDPSNFVRLLDLFNHDFGMFSGMISGFAFDDEETKSIIKRIFIEQGYTLDPHGAVGYLGLKKYLATEKNVNGIFLETAHPGKFREVVEDAIGEKIILPERLTTLLDRKKHTVVMSNKFDDFKEFIGS